jgi:hypothetical protein
VPFQSFWGLGGEERALPNPNGAIFIVGLMENDDGDTENLRGIVAGIVAGTISATLGADRMTIVNRLLQDVNSSLNTITGAPNFDDQVGPPSGTAVHGKRHRSGRKGSPARQSLRVLGDGGDYTLTFKAINRGQAAWRSCIRCRRLCLLPAHDRPGPLGGQDLWRFCDKYFAIFFSGDPGNQDRCPAGGSHNKQGYMFFLPFDHNGPGQDQWRFCDKCRVMFWNGEANKGLCTVGGGHNAQGFNFKLDFTP